jgi:hypothetical protein
MIRFLSRQRNAGGLFLAALICAAATGAVAAPKSELWPRWQAHDPKSTAVIDHGEWQRFLSSYLVAEEDGVNRMQYRRVTAEDRRALQSYIEKSAALPISRFNRTEQLAYWINLYNALTVEVILGHYPVASILDINISPGWFSVGPWGKKLISVEGERLSLDDIEHRILRPIWRDPRIHYVVNCASTGCPNLGREAYTGATIQEKLTQAAKDYINHARGTSFDGDDLFVSSIYKWFREDFGDSDASVIEHLREYAGPELRNRLSRIRDIKGHVYDWSLNDAGKSS